MRLLAIETSTRSAGVAATDGARVVVRRSVLTTHSEVLLKLVDEALTELGLRPADLDGVACGAGPGSFTGLRIGLATAKGLCYALARPLVMGSSLEALAARGPVGSRVVAVLDAFRGEVYAAEYAIEGGGAPGRPRLIGAERTVAPATLADELSGRGEGLLMVGEGAAKYPGVLVAGARRLDDDPAPRPEDLLRLAAPRFLAGEVDDLAAAVPRYLRASAAEQARDAAKAANAGRPGRADTERPSKV
jgi:tRNA threonylcarbamoyladenosine biosynthesis protein TsaB